MPFYQPPQNLPVPRGFQSDHRGIVFGIEARFHQFLVVSYLGQGHQFSLPMSFGSDKQGLVKTVFYRSGR